MADEIPNLWPLDALSLEVRSPLTVLRAQAARLTQMSKGVLRAEVKSVTQGEKAEDKQTYHLLDVTAPAAGNLRRTVVVVVHKEDGAYPARIVQAPDGREYASSEAEFIQILSGVLNSSQTVSALQSLLARSNEKHPGED